MGLFKPAALLILLMLPGLASATFDPRTDIDSSRAPSAAFAHELVIEVADDDWGAASRAEVQQLLDSVAATFLAQVGDPDRPFLVRVEAQGDTPRVLYERGADGAYQVLLSARERHWYQYAYQFAHELCHIVSNFDHKERDAYDEVASANQWFEESLCETASLFTLRRLSEAWQERPPSRNWLAYAPVFAEYADHLLAQPHRQVADGDLERWYADHRAELQGSPYLRQHNEVVATRLLQLFEQQPHYWRTINYLNRDRSSAAKEFEAYLADWQAACPPACRPLVQQTLALFGLATD